MHAHRSLMIRLSGFFLATFAAITVPNGAAQEPLIPGARKWKLANGSESGTPAVLLKATADAGIFQPSKGDSIAPPVTIPWNQLAPEVRNEAILAWFKRDEQVEFDQLRDHLVEFEKLPESKSETFKILFGLPSRNPWSTSGKSFSPYAGLWAAVGMAAGRNENDNAKLLIDQVINRIEMQRKIDPNRHSMTLGAAYNNLAVIHIKRHKGDAAANYFSKAIDAIGYLSPVVRHNANQLTEVLDEGGALRLGDSQRKRLLTTIATTEIQGHQTELPAGWLYSLDFNVPSQSFAAQKVTGIDPPRAGMEILGMGTGVVLADGVVITARSLFDQVRNENEFLVTVCEPKQDGGYRSANVSKLHARYPGMYRSQRIVRGQDGAMLWTSWVYIDTHPNDPSGEIAALEVPGLRVKPTRIAILPPDTEDVVSMFAFRRGPDILTEGLQLATGRLNGAEGVYLHTDMRVEGGSRGAPIVDTYGAVTGIAFNHGPNAGDGRMFPIEQIRRWVDTNVPFAQLREVDPDDFVNLEDETKAATVPVIVWGFREAESSDIFSMVADGSRASGGLYIRDPWCVQCSGLGAIKCPHCRNGTVSSKQRTVVATNQLGGPVYGNRVTQVKCSSCSGNGGFKCPHCNNGRLRF